MDATELVKSIEVYQLILVGLFCLVLFLWATNAITGRCIFSKRTFLCISIQNQLTMLKKIQPWLKKIKIAFWKSQLKNVKETFRHLLNRWSSHRAGKAIRCWTPASPLTSHPSMPKRRMWSTTSPTPPSSAPRRGHPANYRTMVPPNERKWSLAGSAGPLLPLFRPCN